MNLVTDKPVALDPTFRLPIRLALQQAAKVAEQINAAGVEIHSAFDNGRRMVLLIDKAPPFVAGHVKKSFPNGFGGRTYVYGASFHGCQLEWSEDTTGEVSHG